MSDRSILQPEDYLEPACVLCGEPFGAEPEVKSVPQQRILEKLDDYMSRRDYAGAERHLLYWLEEATLGRDLRGQLLIRNELVGHYRKAGDREKAFANGDEALRLLDALGFEDNISAGTTYTNVATAYNAFGENERSMELFEKARAVYEASPRTSPDLLGGLYNNMALTYTALGQYEDAFPLYDKAMDLMATVPCGVLEQAITCLNRADTLAAQKGLEQAEAQINDLVDQAYELLQDPSVPRDGYYAFVCEKCAPSFSYYGYFLAAQELQDISKQIYERD